MLRTTSTPSRFTKVLTTIRDDVRRSYQNAIERATKYVYIENQYVRDQRICS
jgi:hypothetical protein